MLKKALAVWIDWYTFILKREMCTLLFYFLNELKKIQINAPGSKKRHIACSVFLYETNQVAADTKVANPVKSKVPHPRPVNIFPSQRAVPVNTNTNQNLRVGDIHTRILSVDRSH